MDAKAIAISALVALLATPIAVFGCWLAARWMLLDIRFSRLWVPMALQTIITIALPEGLLFGFAGLLVAATVLRYSTGLVSWSQSLPLAVLSTLILYPLSLWLVAIGAGITVYLMP